MLVGVAHARERSERATRKAELDTPTAPTFCESAFTERELTTKRMCCAARRSAANPLAVFVSLAALASARWLRWALSPKGACN